MTSIASKNTVSNTTNMNKSKTFQYLKSYKVLNNGEFNLTNMDKPYGKFNIPTNSKDLKELAKAVAQDNKNNIYPSLVEQHSQDAVGVESLYYDYDMELKEPIQSESWTTLMTDIVYSTIDCISTHFPNVSSNKKHAYVSYRDSHFYKKSTDEEEDVYKYGLHVYFPEMRLSRKDRQLFYGLLLENFSKNRTFAHLPLINGDNNLTAIVDEHVVAKSGIMVYGSTKASKDPYRLQAIFDGEMNQLPIEKTDAFNEEMIYKLLCCLSDKNAQNGESDSPLKLALNKTVENDLVQLYNIRDPDPTEVLPSSNVGKRNLSDRDRLGLVEHAKKLMDMLTKDTWGTGQHDRWLKMVISCANIGGDLLREKCHEVSRKSPVAYNKHKLEHDYSSIMQKNYPHWIQTLTALAKEDSPDLYQAYLERRRQMSLEDSEEASTYMLAKAVKELVGDIFVSTDSQSSSAIWYFDKNKHKWSNKRGYDELMEYLSEDFCKIFRERVQRLEQTLDNESTDKERVLARISHINKNIIDKLNNISFTSQLIKHISCLISDPEFINSLDTNAHLVGFKNGVYDLDRMVFRPGAPSDMISLSTNIDYMPYNSNDPMIAKFMKLLADIHPKEDNREFWLTKMANALHGRRMQQRLYFWLGIGSNGKSTLIDLTRKSFGDLVDTPHVSLLTKPIQNNGGPNPLIVGLKGIRLVIFLEPEQHEKISSSFMKQLFGGDYLKARTLHSKDYVTFRSQCMGVISCNDLPQVQSTDHGTWRRIRTIPHNTEFTEKPKKPHQRMVDPSIEANIGDMCVPFMSVLIEYYRRHIFSETGRVKIFPEPKDVTVATSEFKEDSDLFADYINYTLVESEDGTLDAKDLYQDFQDWFQQEYPGKKPVEFKQFRKRIAQKLEVDPKKYKWNGWKKKNVIDFDNDDAQDGKGNGNGAVGNAGPSF